MTICMCATSYHVTSRDVTIVCPRLTVTLGIVHLPSPLHFRGSSRKVSLLSPNSETETEIKEHQTSSSFVPRRTCCGGHAGSAGQTSDLHYEILLELSYHGNEMACVYGT